MERFLVSLMLVRMYALPGVVGPVLLTLFPSLYDIILMPCTLLKQPDVFVYSLNNVLSLSGKSISSMAILGL